MNFAWWVNKVDGAGNNIFEGGFLGLDNITVVDRSITATDGSRLEQSDATGWMGMFCLNLMRIALELAKENSSYESLATKFFQHYVYVAGAMKRMGNRDYQLWDDEDGFFYDVLSYPDGRFHKFRVRSLVGLIPMFAVERLEEDWIAPFAEFRSNFNWFLENRKDLTEGVVHSIERDGKTTHVLTILDEDQFRRISERLFSPDEFCSDYGIRSLSKAHKAHPFEHDGNVVAYEPAESLIRIKGGNSNWRGPIWFPTSFLLIESFRKLAKAVGEEAATLLPDGQALTFPRMARSPRRPDDLDLHPRRPGPPSRLRRREEIPGRPALARSHPLLRILPRRQRRRPRRLAPDRLDRPRGLAHRRVAMSGRRDCVRRRGRCTPVRHAIPNRVGWVRTRQRKRAGSRPGLRLPSIGVTIP